MKIALVMPAYNAGKVVQSVIERIPPAAVDEIIVVDDASRDNTFEVLNSIPGLVVVRHAQNRGYGGAQITLHETALARGADAVVLMHSDGGHFPEELPQMLAPIRAGQADVVLGARITPIIENARPVLGSKTLGAMLHGPMPALRLAGHLGLTTIQNSLFNAHYDAWHSGFRAVTRGALLAVPYQTFGIGYLFDTEFLLMAHLAHLRVVEVPVSSFYDPRSGSTAEPFSYGWKVLRYVLARRWALWTTPQSARDRRNNQPLT